MPFSADYTVLPDDELIARYKKEGEIALLAALYSRYMPLVYGVCLKYLKNREESQDAVMQIFEKLIGSLKDHTVLHFKSWLYVTAKNYCLMQLRARKGKNFVEISPALMESDPFLHLEDESALDTDVSKLEQCMETLSSEQKWCIQLFFLKQKCYKEITQLTGYEDSKVKSYLQNGKRNLKICMERNGES